MGEAFGIYVQGDSANEDDIGIEGDIMDIDCQLFLTD